MPDGFDFKDIAGEALKQLKDRVAPTPKDEPRWSIWEQQQPQRPQQSQQGFPYGDGAQTAPPFRRDVPAPFQTAPAPMEQSPQMRPEQMLGTGRADERTQNLVYQDLKNAQNQSYRSQGAKLFMQAISRANEAQDPALQAITKVEYGLANMSWGYSQEGFKWILEAGSNNPSIYDSKTNQSFLARLAQVGMSQSAVDLLIQNGKQDPTWYIKDADAAKKLDAAMTGPAFVAPTNIEGPQSPQQRQGADPLAPPTGRADHINPQLDPPAPGRAGGWINEQVNTVLRSASQEKTWQSSFGMYKQAVDMADRSRDPVLQATTRVETGLALMKWGNLEMGYTWLLDAGSKNPEIYNPRTNKGFVDRLAGFGLPKEAINMLLTNGQRDPHWGKTDPAAAKKLEAITRNPNPAPQVVPQPFQPTLPGQPAQGTRRGELPAVPQPTVIPIPKFEPRTVAPPVAPPVSPFEPRTTPVVPVPKDDHKRKSPFG